MNYYFNTKEALDLNQGFILKKGTALYLECENAKEHRLGEDYCSTYRVIIDDHAFFNPFRYNDLLSIREGYPNIVQFAGKSYSRNEFINLILLDKDSNKAAIRMRHTRELLKVEGYIAAYYLDGTMMCAYLLEDVRCYITDRVGYHARVSFRDAKGYDPITNNQVQRIQTN